MAQAQINRPYKTETTLNNMASNTSRPPTKAKGYEAARIIVEEMLDTAQDRRPARRYKVGPKSAGYREGYYMGLLAAHCQNALVNFPKHNVDAIREALARKHGA